MIDGNKYRLKIDEKLLDYTDNIYELQQLQEVDVVNATPPPPFYRARHFKTNSSSSGIWLARIKGCCLYSGIPPSSIIKNMDNIRFSKKNLRVLNLFESSSITKNLKKASAHGIKSVIFSPTELQQSSYSKKIESIFKKKVLRGFLWSRLTPGSDLKLTD